MEEVLFLSLERRLSSFGDSREEGKQTDLGYNAAFALFFL